MDRERSSPPAALRATRRAYPSGARVLIGKTLAHLPRPELAFASPRKLPRARELKGRVVVLDVAFASEASGGGFEKITLPFIEELGPRLAGWVDHHDHVMHDEYRRRSAVRARTKAEHGACPEMVTPELVARIGPVDTIVCHTDFDGLCSAAKWLRGGTEPYAGADDDARAIDTRIGAPSATGSASIAPFALARATRRCSASSCGTSRVDSRDASLWQAIDAAAAELRPIEASHAARRAALPDRRLEEA